MGILLGHCSRKGLGEARDSEWKSPRIHWHWLCLALLVASQCQPEWTRIRGRPAAARDAHPVTRPSHQTPAAAGRRRTRSLSHWHGTDASAPVSTGCPYCPPSPESQTVVQVGSSSIESPTESLAGGPESPTTFNLNLKPCLLYTSPSPRD